MILCNGKDRCVTYHGYINIICVDLIFPWKYVILCKFWVNSVGSKEGKGGKPGGKDVE